MRIICLTDFVGNFLSPKEEMKYSEEKRIFGFWRNRGFFHHVELSHIKRCNTMIGNSESQRFERIKPLFVFEENTNYFARILGII